MPTLALIAHDEKKDEIVAFCQRHRTKLSTLKLITTGTTGQRISAATGLDVECVLYGPLGGDAQIAARVATGAVQAVFFLVDPLSAQPHEPDIQGPLRVCNVHNIPLAADEATAEALMKMM
jgi:methylglyoxal synthase